MERAVVLIGVRKAGALDELQAAHDGVAAMEAWAVAQGIDRRYVLTDATEEVLVSGVADAIEAVIDAGTVEQLIVYFAGHGVNKFYSEYWLLSRAPARTGEAVNVSASVELARRSGIPHVVFISDACRTAPEGIGAQPIVGTPIFPNLPGLSASTIDQFFATRVGDAAHEIRDPHEASGRFRSAYTDVVVRSLNGQRPDLLDTDDGLPGFLLLRPWPLKRALPDLMLDELANLGVDLIVTQEPDSIVTSDPDRAFLSLVPQSDVDKAVGVLISGPGPALSDMADDVLVESLGGRLLAARGFAGDPLNTVVDSATRLEQPFGPPHYETGSGVKILGADVVDARVASAELVDFWDDGVRTSLNGAPAANLFVQFASGRCAVLPVIDQFIGSLMFEEDRLVSVAYEPMDYSPQWDVVAGRIDEVRRVRALAAAASQQGAFRPRDATGLDLARHMQELKGLDPTLAVYAAYAYNDLGLTDRIREMHGYQRDGIGISLFDVALLARAILDGEAIGRPFPSFPMLSRGWSLLTVFGGDLPERLKQLPAYLTPSLWTLFEREAAPLLIAALESGELG